MPTYTAPTRDTRFIINEMLDLASYGNLPGFEMASPDVTDAVIGEGGKFCAEVLAPLNSTGAEAMRSLRLLTGEDVGAAEGGGGALRL